MNFHPQLHFVPYTDSHNSFLVGSLCIPEVEGSDNVILNLNSHAELVSASPIVANAGEGYTVGINSIETIEVDSSVSLQGDNNMSLRGDNGLSTKQPSYLVNAVVQDNDFEQSAGLLHFVRNDMQGVLAGFFAVLLNVNECYHPV